MFLDAHLDEYQLPFAEMVGADVTLNNMTEVVALKQRRPHLPETEHEVSLSRESTLLDEKRKKITSLSLT